MKELRKPPRLRPGDTIGIAALAGPVDADRLEVGCQRLRALGYRLRLARNLLVRCGTLGLAGSDVERHEAYRELLRNPEVRAILFARGGYGVTRVLPLLDPEEVGANLKIHCGFSDLTALSAFLLARCGIPSFHGPMVAADLAAEPHQRTDAFFPSMLEGRGPAELALDEADVLVPGDASGPLLGGCLSLLAAMAGTPDEPDYDGAVLFLEDLNEEAYRLDRMLGTLVYGGRFAKLRGILIGSLTGITFGGGEDAGRLRALLLERLEPIGVPVVFGLPAGHTRPNVTLPLGARVTWSCASRRLRFDEEIVTG